MQPFQKPENALIRANELQEIGQDGLALKVLHSAIGHKKFKMQGWDCTQEKIMLRYVCLCVDLKKLRLARDGLHQYRTIAQQANIHSLGKVICEFRERAEKQNKDVRAKIQIDELKEEMKVEDLDMEESPESLMLSTLQIEVRDTSGREYHKAMRFLWESYKVILDILRTAPKLEKIYHDTAHKAFLFCKENARLQEFRRLCEVLRNNYMLAMRYKHKGEYEQLLRADIHLETRMLQLNVACEMNLWREAFNTAEDIYNLGIHDLYHKSFRYNGGGEIFYKSREKLLKWLAMYYEKMAKILWVSDNYMFHSLSWLKYLLHVRNFKKTIQESEMQNMASIAVLSVLAIPLSNTAVEKKMEGYMTSIDSSAIALEHNKKLVSLLGHATLPTRESLKHALIFKDILSMANPECQKLYALLENDFTPLRLCTECQPLLEKIAESHEQYVFAIKKIIFHKLILQLSKVYTSISVDYFTTHICPKEFFPWSEAEKVVVSLVHEGSVQMRLDYTVNAIYFGAATVDPAVTMRNALAELGRQLNLCVHTMIKKGMSEKEKLEKKKTMESIQSKLEEEHIRIKQRNKENDQRRLEKQEEQAKAEEEKKRQQEAMKLLEETQERQRREEALKKREEQRMKEEKYKAKSETAQQMLEEIKKIGGGKDKSNKIIIKGKYLDEINIEDVLEGNVGFEDFEKAQEEQRIKERAERIRQRKLEAKRMEHFVRACREEEMILLLNWKQETLSRDTQILLELQSKHEEEHKAAFQEALKEKQMFEVVVPDKQKWVENAMQQRKVEFEKKYVEQSKRLLNLLKQRKIERARDRRDVELEKERIEAEKKRREEEEKRIAAEKEAKRLEEEARKKKLGEMAERRRLRELEVEEKHRLAYEMDDYDRDRERDRDGRGRRSPTHTKSGEDGWRKQDSLRSRDDDDRRMRDRHRRYDRERDGYDRGDRERERYDGGGRRGDRDVRDRDRFDRDRDRFDRDRERFDRDRERFDRDREGFDRRGGGGGGEREREGGGGRYERDGGGRGMYDRDGGRYDRGGERYDRDREFEKGGERYRYDREGSGRYDRERMERSEGGGEHRDGMDRDRNDRMRFRDKGREGGGGGGGARERGAYGGGGENDYGGMGERKQRGVERKVNGIDEGVIDNENNVEEEADEDGFTTVKRKGRK